MGCGNNTRLWLGNTNRKCLSRLAKTEGSRRTLLSERGAYSLINLCCVRNTSSVRFTGGITSQIAENESGWKEESFHSSSRRWATIKRGQEKTVEEGTVSVSRLEHTH